MFMKIQKKVDHNKDQLQLLNWKSFKRQTKTKSVNKKLRKEKIYILKEDTF